MFQRLALTLILLLTSLTAFGESVSGTEISGQIGLSGALKKLVLTNSLPIGSLTGTQGYEVLDFSSVKEYKNPAKKMLYCQGGMTLSADTKLLGFSFGGNAASIHTFGECKKPEDYTGGFLKLGIGYSGTKGSKSVGFSADINYGFSLGSFAEQLWRYYLNGYDNNGNWIHPKTRIKAIAKHFASYLKIKSKKTFEKRYTLIKLLTFPLFPFWADDLTQMSFGLDDAETINNHEKSGFSLRLDKFIADFEYDVLRDLDFYECPDLDNYSGCVERAADALSYLKILKNNFGSCHSVTMNLSLTTDYSLSLFRKSQLSNFSLYLGYFNYHLERRLNSRSSTRSLATKYFAGHKFNYRSPECLKASSTAAGELGTFLSILKN